MAANITKNAQIDLLDREAALNSKFNTLNTNSIQPIPKANALCEAFDLFSKAINRIESKIQHETDNLKVCQAYPTKSPFGSQEQEMLDKQKLEQEIREINENLSELKEKLKIFKKICTIIHSLYFQQKYLTDKQAEFMLGYANERAEYVRSCHEEPPKICSYIESLVFKFSQPLVSSNTDHAASSDSSRKNTHQLSSSLASRMNTVTAQASGLVGSDSSKVLTRAETKEEPKKESKIDPKAKLQTPAFGEFLTVPKTSQHNHHNKGQKRKHHEMGKKQGEKSDKQKPIVIDDDAKESPHKKMKGSKKK